MFGFDSQLDDAQFDDAQFGGAQFGDPLGQDTDLGFAVPRRRLEEADMDITPMIDITFLLLIFFIVASRIDADTQVSLPSARHGTAVATKSSVILTLAGEVEPATVFKGDGTVPGTELSSTDPEDQEREIVEYVRRAMDDGRENVILKAEKNVRHREVARVARAIGLVEGSRLYVAVLEEN